MNIVYFISCASLLVCSEPWLLKIHQNRTRYISPFDEHFSFIHRMHKPCGYIFKVEMQIVSKITEGAGLACEMNTLTLRTTKSHKISSAFTVFRNLIKFTLTKHHTQKMKKMCRKLGPAAFYFNFEHSHR